MVERLLNMQGITGKDGEAADVFLLQVIIFFSLRDIDDMRRM